MESPSFPGELCTQYWLSGSQSAADLRIKNEFTRIAGELLSSRSGQEDADGKASSGEEKVYTLYLRPPGSILPAREDETTQIHLPWANKELLAQRVAAEIESLYAKHGSAGLDELLDSVRESTYRHVMHVMMAKDPDVRVQLDFANAVTFPSAEEARDAGDGVKRQCEIALKALQERRKSALEGVEAAGAMIAVGRLDQARQEILNEKARYLHIFGEEQDDDHADEQHPAGEHGEARGRDRQRTASPSPRQLSDKLVDVSEVGLSRVELRGAGVADLLPALRALRRARNRLDSAASTVETLRNGVLARRATFGDPAGRHPWSTDAVVAAKYPDAVADLSAATEDLKQLLMVYGRPNPILFRIWDRPELPPEVEKHPTLPSLTYSTTEGFIAIEALKGDIAAGLNRAWDGNSLLWGKIEGDPAAVWSYQPVVAAALDDLEIQSPSVGFRAAQERLAETLGMSTAATLALIAGAVEAAAVIFGAAPPIAVALACISLATSAVADVLAFLDTLEREAAFNAVLDPGKALSAEPDYTGLLVGVAFSLFGIKGVRDAALVATTGERVAAGVGLAVSGGVLLRAQHGSSGVTP